MKRMVSILLFALLSIVSLSQGVKIGSNNDSQDPSSLFELESTSQGFLPPRMTSNQRDAIQNPAIGLMVMNIDSNCMEYYRGGGTWYSMCPRVAIISTTAPSAIGEYSAQTGGVISDDGGASVTLRGVCWSTSSGPTISDNATDDGPGQGTFVSSLTGLIPGTTYYARAYATNSAGTAYGNEVVFTTVERPEVITLAMSLIYGKNATAAGNVPDEGSSAVTARGICWSTSASPTLADDFIVSGSGLGSFTEILSDLSYSTTYYLRAYATNAAGTSYGNEETFTTTSGTLVSYATVGNQTWTIPSGVRKVEVLVVGGGGGGGGVIGGGGGAGGVIHEVSLELPQSPSVSVLVGAGGEGGRNWDSNQQNGKPGSNSVFGTLTAIGGGGGRHHGGATSSTQMNGGSGGGGAGQGLIPGGLGTAGQGFGGGDGNDNNGGGGGGAGETGENFVGNVRGGNGGEGVNLSASFGVSVGQNGWFGGGGGGGTRTGNGTFGLGGQGGGGNGSTVDSTKQATDGLAGTGGGGGGAGYNGGSVCAACGVVVAGNGGSGAVHIKY